MPSGLSRTTSRPSSTDRPERWTSAANARSAVVLRIPCDPMNATFAGRGQGPGADAGPGVADWGLRGMWQAYGGASSADGELELGDEVGGVIDDVATGY